MIGKIATNPYNAQTSKPYKIEEEPRRRENGVCPITQLRERQATMRERMRQMAKEMEAAREAARAQAEYFRLMRIAMEIAARIIRGDNVPQSDKDFLLEHSPGMFKLAMAARNHNNEDPKDYEALAREGDDNSPAAAVVATATVASTPAVAEAAAE